MLKPASCTIHYEYTLGLNASNAFRYCCHQHRKANEGTSASKSSKKLFRSVVHPRFPP